MSEYMDPYEEYEPQFDDRVVDITGREIVVGDRVVVFNGEKDELGIVKEVSDFDGDVDDDTGRSIVIPPYVFVQFAEDDDRFPTFQESYEGPMVCEDVEIVQKEELNSE